MCQIFFSFFFFLKKYKSNKIPYRNIMKKMGEPIFWSQVAWAGQRGKVGLINYKSVVKLIKGEQQL